MKKWPFYLAATNLFVGGLLTRSWAQTSEPPRPPRDFVPPIRPPFPIPRPRPLPAPLTELQLVEQRAQVEIRGPLAKTHLRQTLKNPTGRPLEGSYLFALPKGAAVSNFAMTMNDKRLEAEILEGDKARDIYTGIVQKLKDPAILEFLDRDLVRAKIFPVPANGTVEIELDYAQTITDNRYTLPLRAPGASSDGPIKASIEVKLDDPNLRSVYSPSHSVETKRQGNSTLVTGEFGSTQDFSLLWTRGEGKVSLDMLTYRGDESDGYFLLLATPDPKIATKEIEAKDVVFVFDTSGSMEGEKIEQARRALKTLLSNLNAGDRFNIVTFASGVQPFRDGLIAATPGNISAARSFADGIKAVGGTNISEALQSALKMTQDSPRPQQVVFMTDGQPTVGETNVDDILREAKGSNAAKARLFVFGVGYDVNARLLDSLAEDNRGASDYVLPKEDIETKVGSLYEKIAFPVLSDAKIDFGALSAYDVYPPHLPDLFRGSQVTVFGRYRGEGKGKLILSGQSSGQKVSYDGRIAGSGTSELPKLWATRKIGFLLDDARRAGRPVDGEVKDEIIELSRKFGIVTPLTAALITEDGPILGNIPLGGGFGGGRRDNDVRARGGFGNLNNAVTDLQSRPVPNSAPASRYMAQSGQAGVVASQTMKSLRDGRSETIANSKTIEGKTFTLVEGVWTDATFDAKTSGTPRVIKFASDEYFALLKDPKLAKWLSVGNTILLIWNGKPLKIEP